MSLNSRPARSLRPKSGNIKWGPLGSSPTRQKFTAAAAALALSFAASGAAGAAPLWSGGMLAGGPVAVSWVAEPLVPGGRTSHIILAESVPEPEPPSSPDKKPSRAGRSDDGNGEARPVWRKSAQCTYKLTRHGKKVPCNEAQQVLDFIFLGLLFD